MRDTVVYLLSNVPGLPPIVQTVHLLGIAVVMSSVVLLDLRILGLALPSQDVAGADTARDAVGVVDAAGDAVVRTAVRDRTAAALFHAIRSSA